MSNQETDRTKLTFSQAEGIDPLPQPADLGELPGEARTDLWNITYESFIGEPWEWGQEGRLLGSSWSNILYDYHTSLLHQPADEFSPYWNAHCIKIKNIFLNGDYNRVFDFLQFVLRHASVPTKFCRSVVGVLEKRMCAYTVVKDGATIVPIALPEQRESIQEDFRVLQSGPFEGARSHLRKSAECINNGALAESVRESIHAVESVARCLDAGAATSLNPALDALRIVGSDQRHRKAPRYERFANPWRPLQH